MASTRDELIEELAKDLLNARYKVLPRPVEDAWDKFSPQTRAMYRRQAEILLEQGWKK